MNVIIEKITQVTCPLAIFVALVLELRMSIRLFWVYAVNGIMDNNL